jgi:precorrin-8X/cobalt-precorrin-8 methylmutase
VSGPPTPRYPYERAPDAIYRQSFATIRAEADLGRLADSMRPVAVRMIHATGDIGLAGQIEHHRDLVPAARDALAGGAPILTDAKMIASGITRRRLPKDN